MFLTIGVILLVLLVICASIDYFDEAVPLLVLLMGIYLILSLFIPASTKESIVDRYEVVDNHIYIDSDVILKFEDPITLKIIEQDNFDIVKETNYVIWGYAFNLWEFKPTYKIIPKDVQSRNFSR
jgi:hypothetical protein